MIAVLCETPDAWLAVGGAMRRVRRSADGPFRVLRGTMAGDELTAWSTGPSADEQYAAARMAVRRGARILVHLGTARSLDPVPHPALRPVRRALDLGKLDRIQRLSPDSATELPIPLPEVAEADMFDLATGSDESWALASTAFPLTVPALGHGIRQRWGAALFDCSACGMCRAAREERVFSVAWKMIVGQVARRSALAAETERQRMETGREWHRFASADLGSIVAESAKAAEGSE